MKRVLSIIAGYIFFCMGVCVAWAFCSGMPLPILLPRSVVHYKICAAISLFCSLLPAILEGGFVVALAIVFGSSDQESSRDRFSPAMFKRYRQVTIVCIICVAALTAATELGQPLVVGRQRHLEAQAPLARDYERTGANMYREGSFELAHQYALLALELDPDSDVAKRLLADAGIGREAGKSSRNSTAKADTQVVLVSPNLSEEGYTVGELRALAEKAFDKSEWFDAHYYAQTAVNMAEPRDTNVPYLRDMAAEAWNKLEIPDGAAQTEEGRLYAQKLSGYGALMRGDNLRAYYIFMSMSRLSRKMASDPDVMRYLALAQERLENAYFFIDETMNKKDFETVHRVKFALKHNDGTTDIIHIKGIVPVAGAAGTVQYLRGFSMVTLDQSGNMRRKLYDENVKMLEVNAADFGNTLDLPSEAATVPYLLLRSVDRYDDKFVNEARCIFQDSGDAKADKEAMEKVPDTLVLPMSCEDFELVKEASKGAQFMDILALLKIISRADYFGYSSEVFAQVLLDRLLYPMLILCTLMLLASVAWNFRTMNGTPFQTAWMLSFPILTALAQVMMQIILWLYRVMNHVFVGVAGLTMSPIFGFVIYILIFIIVSIIFLARNNIDTASHH